MKLNFLSLFHTQSATLQNAQIQSDPASRKEPSTTLNLKCIFSRSLYLTVCVSEIIDNGKRVRLKVTFEMVEKYYAESFLTHLMHKMFSCQGHVANCVNLDLDPFRSLHGWTLVLG